jgi:hypothetical protein
MPHSSAALDFERSGGGIAANARLVNEWNRLGPVRESFKRHWGECRQQSVEKDAISSPAPVRSNFTEMPDLALALGRSDYGDIPQPHGVTDLEFCDVSLNIVECCGVLHPLMRGW